MKMLRWWQIVGRHHSAPADAAKCQHGPSAVRAATSAPREETLSLQVAGRRGRWGTPHRGAIGALALTAMLALASIWLVASAERDLPTLLARAEAASTIVVDRDDRLLRAYTTPDGRWRLPVTTAEVDDGYIAMLLTYEDRRFHSHFGVDPRALLRAALQAVKSGRIVSGASTITMQVARLLEGPERRGISTKLRQAALAVALERRLTKSEILSLYLRLAPFGGNIEGVRAAALTYFGKEPRRLSPGERALLVAIPQSPEARKPDRDPKAARRARDRVLARAASFSVITKAEADAARSEPVPNARKPFPRLAPHLADAELATQPDRAIHRTTLDSNRQAALETLAAEHVHRLGPKLSAAIIAVEHATGRIVANVGSAGYLDHDRLGAIDMTTAVRSPGSTLKPLVYGLAFERGLAHPETLIEDQPARFGTYKPANFDEEFRGTVSIREALATSLNIPAVKVMAEVGPRRMIGRMAHAGIDVSLPAGAEPSLAVALGGVGTSLHDLARLYAALARGGEAIPLVHRREATQIRTAAQRQGCATRAIGTGTHRALRPIDRTACAPTRLLSAAAAWQLADILKDAPPPANARGNRIAFKTGTSYGYRDGWAVGFDGRHTVAVWVGRADGSATAGLTGLGSAAPLLFDAFQRLAERTTPLPPAPHGVLRARNGELPVTLRRFKEGTGAANETSTLAIAFPPDKAELEFAADDTQEIILKADGGAGPLVWMVDGLPLETAGDGREAVWTPSSAGFAKISVIDAAGRSERVTIRLR